MSKGVSPLLFFDNIDENIGVQYQQRKGETNA